MRILFVCAGFQAGLDGVGDYVRLLAGALDNLGHVTAVLALNDKAVTTLTDGNAPRPTLQLPSVTDWHVREGLASAFVARFAPDWLSIQFVCYGFHKQGIPLGLPARLQRIAGPQVGLQVMFHELAVGVGADAPAKYRLLGTLQRELVIKPLARLAQVRAIHTNIAPHADVLERWGAHAEVLPLFGNIPIVNSTSDERAAWWQRHFDVQRDNFYFAGTFGSLKGDVLSDSFVEELLTFAHSKGKRLLIGAAGHLTEAGQSYFDKKRNRYEGRALFRRLGRLAAEDVSLYLSTLDLGIASSPWLYIGKSGAVAAMLEHGLPVVVSRNDMFISSISRNGLEHETLLACFGHKGFSEWLQRAARVPAQERRSGVAARFAQSLMATVTITRPNSPVGHRK